MTSPPCVFTFLTIVEIYSIYPAFGPVAGGTVVTLTGEHLERILAVVFVPECRQRCVEYSPIVYPNITHRYALPYNKEKNL